MHRCWQLGALACALGVACDEPPPVLDSGPPDSGTDAGSFDAGPPVDHSRPGLVPIVASCEVPATPEAGEVQLAEDVEYATAGGESQRLDVAWPLSGADHRLVVMIHGGGWTTGDKTDERVRDFILRLASIGYTAASINYRLATPGGDNLFPTAIEDVRCALRWMLANAATYDADPSRVVAAGASAGGHLALMLLLAGDAGGFDGACSSTEPFALAGAIDFYGPSDIRAGTFADPLGEVLIAAFLGDTAANVPDVAERASPITYLEASDLPPLILHGAGDGVVPVEQSRDLQAAFEDLGIASTYVEIPVAPHAFDLLTEEPRYRTSTCTTLAYLDAIFGAP